MNQNIGNVASFTPGAGSMQVHQRGTLVFAPTAALTRGPGEEAPDPGGSLLVTVNGAVQSVGGAFTLETQSPPAYGCTQATWTGGGAETSISVAPGDWVSFRYSGGTFGSLTGQIDHPQGEMGGVSAYGESGCNRLSVGFSMRFEGAGGSMSRVLANSGYAEEGLPAVLYGATDRRGWLEIRAPFVDALGGIVLLRGDASASLSASPNTFGRFHVPYVGYMASVEQADGGALQWAPPPAYKPPGYWYDAYRYFADGGSVWDAQGRPPPGPTGPHRERLSAAVCGSGAFSEFVVCPRYQALQLLADRDTLGRGETTRLTPRVLDPYGRPIRPCGDLVPVTLTVSDPALAELAFNGNVLADTARVTLRALLAGDLRLRIREQDEGPPALAKAHRGPSGAGFAASRSEASGANLAFAGAAGGGLFVRAEHGGIVFADGGAGAERRIHVVNEVLQLLRQNDARIPTDPADTNAVLMVSKFRPDDRLDSANVPFDSPYRTRGVAEDSLQNATAGDLFTFRPEVRGVLPTDSVKFRLWVQRPRLRNGVWSRPNVTFRPGDGQLTAGACGLPSGECYEYGSVARDSARRGSRFVRLVSNAPPTNPAHVLPGSRYDDEYRGPQTVRVELGDEVKVAALVRDAQGAWRRVGQTLTVPVGRPASETNRFAPRRVALSWRVPKGVATAPTLITSRLGEDWAQAGVYFEKHDSVAYDEKQNVFRLTIRDSTSHVGRWKAKRSGSLSLPLRLSDGSRVNVNVTYQAGDSLKTIASTILSSAPTGRNVRILGYADSSSYYFVFDRNGTVRSTVVADSTGELILAQSFVDYERPFESHLVAISVNHRGAASGVIDLIAVPGDTLWREPWRREGWWGVAWPRRSVAPSLLNARGSSVLSRLAVDARDDLFAVAAHEVGHLLFDGTFDVYSTPEHPTVRGRYDPTHSSLLGNVMHSWLDLGWAESARWPKRLTFKQMLDARRDQDRARQPADPHRLMKRCTPAQTCP